VQYCPYRPKHLRAHTVLLSLFAIAIIYIAPLITLNLANRDTPAEHHHAQSEHSSKNHINSLGAESHQHTKCQYCVLLAHLTGLIFTLPLLVTKPDSRSHLITDHPHSKRLSSRYPCALARAPPLLSLFSPFQTP
jgi:uncharacterized membrane protein YbjE (DUF340 family)